jgi:hypothetical protein
MELITHLNAELQPQMLEIKLEHGEELLYLVLFASEMGLHKGITHENAA